MDGRGECGSVVEGCNRIDPLPGTFSASFFSFFSFSSSTSPLCRGDGKDGGGDAEEYEAEGMGRRVGCRPEWSGGEVALWVWVVENESLLSPPTATNEEEGKRENGEIHKERGEGVGKEGRPPATEWWGGGGGGGEGWWWAGAVPPPPLRSTHRSGGGDAPIAPPPPPLSPCPTSRSTAMISSFTTSSACPLRAVVVVSSCVRL